jgi:hypothetical protein
LKPVIKKQTHYNVLLMRDDRESITFRIYSGLLHFCLGLFILLLLCGGAGIYGGLHFFTKYRELAEVQEARERENAEMRLQLERLVNLESLLKAGNGTQPQATYTEVGVPDLPARVALVPPPPAAGPPAAGSGTAGTPAAPLPAATAAPNATGRATEGPAPPAQTENAVSEDKDTAPAMGENAAPAVAPSAAQTAAGVEYPPLSDAGSLLRINEFSARNVGPLRLRISYDLSTTTDGQRTVSGSAKYTALLADGTRVDLPLLDPENTRFAISRMKPMQNTIRLPQNLKSENITAIDILIETADKTYRDSYQVRLQ